jgi:hypothetical protein
VSVDQAGRNEAAGAVIIFVDRLHQLVRLLALRAAPSDLLAVADHGRVFDHPNRSSGEQAADVAEASHLVKAVRPPTTTFVTSQPEWP